MGEDSWGPAEAEAGHPAEAPSGPPGVPHLVSGADTEEEEETEISLTLITGRTTKWLRSAAVVDPQRIVATLHEFISVVDSLLFYFFFVSTCDRKNEDVSVTSTSVDCLTPGGGRPTPSIHFETLFLSLKVFLVTKWTKLHINKKLWSNFVALHQSDNFPTKVVLDTESCTPSDTVSGSQSL